MAIGCVADERVGPADADADAEDSAVTDAGAVADADAPSRTPDGGRAANFSPQAVLAGACEVQRIAADPSKCTGLDELLACSTEQCGLAACMATCQDYLQCVTAADDRCPASVHCARSVECVKCSTSVQVCTLALNCFGTYTCATPTPAGSCSKLEACCATQRGPDACQRLARGQAALGGDSACEELLHNQGFLEVYASDPPCADSGPLDGAAKAPDAGLSDAGSRAAGPSHDARVGDAAGDAAANDKPAALADQTPPSMVNGISVDESGYLWVAAGWESQLLRLEPPGEKIVERHASEWELDGPDDLVATPEAVYYTAMLAGNVNKLDRRTGKNSVLGSVGIGANPIVLTSEGVLLVGIAPGPVPELAPFFTGLFEVDRTGVERPRTVLRDSRSINAFCVAPDGYAYGPTQTAVLRIDLTTGAITTVRDGFSYAGSVRFNPRDQLLYVLDVAPEQSPRAAVLYQMGLDGSGFAVFARLSAVSGDSYSADNFAIAEDGTFYVTRLYEPKITRVSADGSRTDDFTIGKPRP